jgi:hypothetical protein
MNATAFVGLKGPLVSLGGYAALDSAFRPSRLASIRAARAARE